jgi:hypothetical protein
MHVYKYCKLLDLCYAKMCVCSSHKLNAHSAVEEDCANHVDVVDLKVI